MSDVANLKAVLDISASRVDSRKLQALERSLQAALGRTLSAVAVNDPVAIRERLIAHLRDYGASRGTIQAMEQFYMGIMRRAAVHGLVPAPPEGPWTREWQAALDSTADIPGVRASLRSLAAWATRTGLSPEAVNGEHIEQWAHEVHVGEDAVSRTRRALAGWTPPNTLEDLASDQVRANRLRSKAQRGTVRPSPVTETSRGRHDDT